MKLKITRKDIIVTNSGYIRPLKIIGPVDSPISIELEKIAALLQNGYKVFEVLKNGAKIKLNLINFDKVNGDADSSMTTTYESPNSVVRKTKVITVTDDDIRKKNMGTILADSTKRMPDKMMEVDGKPQKHYIETKPEKKEKPVVEEIEEK
jgi:hypothetical protein